MMVGFILSRHFCRRDSGAVFGGLQTAGRYGNIHLILKGLLIL